MPTFNHSTVTQLRAALREEFRSAKGIQLANLSEFFLTLTNSQLGNIFNLLTTVQINNLRTRLQAKVDKRNALLSEVGE